MAEADVEQLTSANGAQGQGEQITPEPETLQPWTEEPAPTAPETRTADRRRTKIIACLALAVGGALAVIRSRMRARSQRGRRRWRVFSAMRNRTSRGHRATGRARLRKLRCR
jgi:hypothetical protein